MDIVATVIGTLLIGLFSPFLGFCFFALCSLVFLGIGWTLTSITPH